MVLPCGSSVIRLRVSCIVTNLLSLVSSLRTILPSLIPGTILLMSRLILMLGSRIIDRLGLILMGLITRILILVVIVRLFIIASDWLSLIG